MTASRSQVLLFGLLALLLAAPYVKAAEHATDRIAGDGDWVHESVLTSRAVCRTKPQLRDETAVAGPPTADRPYVTVARPPAKRPARSHAPGDGRETYLRILVLLI
jgi:hypothetical protein